MTLDIRADVDSIWVSGAYGKASITARTIGFIIKNNEVVEKEKMKIKLSVDLKQIKIDDGFDRDSTAVANFLITMAAAERKGARVTFTVDDSISNTSDNQGHQFKLFKVSEITVKRDTPEGVVTESTFKCVV